MFSASSDVAITGTSVSSINFEKILNKLMNLYENYIYNKCILWLTYNYCWQVGVNSNTGQNTGGLKYLSGGKVYFSEFSKIPEKPKGDQAACFPKFD